MYYLDFLLNTQLRYNLLWITCVWNYILCQVIGQILVGLQCTITNLMQFYSQNIYNSDIKQLCINLIVKTVGYKSKATFVW